LSPMRKPYPTDHSVDDEPDRLAGARPWQQRPPRRFHPLAGGSTPPCWRLPFTSRPHVHPCRSLLLAPASAKQSVVTLFARWVSVGTSAQLYAAARQVVGEAQSLTSLRALTRHPTGRGYAGCCIPTSQKNPFPGTPVNKAVENVDNRAREAYTAG
jgi:hypothetical protein